ncbi:hypothetical protein COOONC_20166 [Cooperia oncophora]
MTSWIFQCLLVIAVVNHPVVLAQATQGSPQASTSDTPTSDTPTSDPPTSDPATTAAATTELSTTEATTTAAPQPNNRICPTNSGMIDSTRVSAKSAHNYRRARLARGEVTNKAGKNLPAAT